MVHIKCLRMSSSAQWRNGDHRCREYRVCHSSFLEWFIVAAPEHHQKSDRSVARNNKHAHEQAKPRFSFTLTCCDISIRAPSKTAISQNSRERQKQLSLCMFISHLTSKLIHLAIVRKRSKFLDVAARRQAENVFRCCWCGEFQFVGNLYVLVEKLIGK